MGKLLRFVPGKNAVSLNYENVVTEIIKITPSVAAKWLEQNHLNRKIRAKQVLFLANEMTHQRWMLTGEAIIISDTEDVLEGQHRLLACVESGKAFVTQVTYGITREAFKAMGQGIPRIAGDAVKLNFPDVTDTVAMTMGSTIRKLHGLMHGMTTTEANRKISNTEVLWIIRDHPDLWRCLEILSGYPKNQRLLPITDGAALFHLFAKKSWDDADTFMNKLYVGEKLSRSEAVYVARGILQRDLMKLVKMRARDKVFMVVKTWNAFRSNKKAVTTSMLRRRADEKFPKIR